MNIKVLIFLTRNQCLNKDDVLTVFQKNDTHFLTVKYRPGDGSRIRSFDMSERETMTYLSDIFKSLEYDTDPFDKIQLTTSIHPSVLYEVATLGDKDVRYRMEDMIQDALRANVRFTK